MLRNNIYCFLIQCGMKIFLTRHGTFWKKNRGPDRGDAYRAIHNSLFEWWVEWKWWCQKCDFESLIAPLNRLQYPTSLVSTTTSQTHHYLALLEAPKLICPPGFSIRFFILDSLRSWAIHPFINYSWLMSPLRKNARSSLITMSDANLKGVVLDFSD